MTHSHYRLSLFEEASGPFHELSAEQEMLVARVGKIYLALPHEKEAELRPLIGQRITILHTDIPNKSYIFRILTKEAAIPSKGDSGLPP
jgi:hypothetical protein